MKSTTKTIPTHVPLYNDSLPPHNQRGKISDLIKTSTPIFHSHEILVYGKDGDMVVHISMSLYIKCKHTFER